MPHPRRIRLQAARRRRSRTRRLTSARAQGRSSGGVPGSRSTRADPRARPGNPGGGRGRASSSSDGGEGLTSAQAPGSRSWRIVLEGLGRGSELRGSAGSAPADAVASAALTYRRRRGPRPAESTPRSERTRSTKHDPRRRATVAAWRSQRDEAEVSSGSRSSSSAPRAPSATSARAEALLAGPA